MDNTPRILAAAALLLFAFGSAPQASGDTNIGTVITGTNPIAMAVNSVTNKIYVANYETNTVTVIDGATQATITIPTGTNPGAVAVNPVTNKIYVANLDDNVTVVDGATNATTNIGTGPFFQVAVAINPVTNKIYVANNFTNDVTVIDGATNATTTVPTGSGPQAVAVNSVTTRFTSRMAATVP